MRAHADPMPCHHPKWPMQCPHCDKPALGFNVSIPLGQRWNPEAKKMGRWAWGTSGMACLDCNIAIIPQTVSEGITIEYVRAIVEADIPGLTDVQFVPEPWFNEHCRLPAEEPTKAT